MLPKRPRNSTTYHLTLVLVLSASLSGCDKDTDATVPDAGGQGTTAETCTPGDARCSGDLHYQPCTPSGTWGDPESCSGYGTADHCAVVYPGTERAWSACVEPACWYWLGHGLVDLATPAGRCTEDGRFQECSDDGTLSNPTDCAAGCRAVTTMDGEVFGVCEESDAAAP